MRGKRSGAATWCSKLSANAAETLKLDAALRIEARMKLAGGCQFLGDLPRFLRVGPPLLAMLERDSGLIDYQQLDPALEPQARLMQALSAAQQRYEATPELERGLPVPAAIRELARISVMFIGMNTSAQDRRLVDRVASLEPFAALSPAVSVIHEQVEAARAFAQGREQLGRQRLLAALARIAQPDGAGLGALYARSMKLTGLQAIALNEAMVGLPDAWKRVGELETQAGYRVNAHRVHMACHLMQGDVEAAAAAQRRAELVMVQDGHVQRYPGTTLRTEVCAYWLSGDAAGLKDVIERLSRLTEHYPGWSMLHELTRALHRTLQGDHLGALSTIEPALVGAEPMRQRDWAWVAAAHVQILTALGRIEDACTLGLGYAQISEQNALGGYRLIALWTADALIAAGRTRQAIATADALIAAAGEQGVRGIMLGALYELRARAALAEHDKATFEQYADRCAAAYRIDRNPALAARHQRLIRDLAPQSTSTVPPPLLADAESSVASSVATVMSRILECDDSRARGVCVLTILAEHTNAERAYLFGMRSGKLSFLHGLPDETRPDSLDASVTSFLALQLEPEAATVHLEDDDEASVSVDQAALEHARSSSAASSPAAAELRISLPDEAELRFCPLLIASMRDGERVIAGVAAVAIRGHITYPQTSLIEALASALLEHDDVDPISCFE